MICEELLVHIVLGIRSLTEKPDVCHEWKGKTLCRVLVLENGVEQWQYFLPGNSTKCCPLTKGVSHSDTLVHTSTCNWHFSSVYIINNVYSSLALSRKPPTRVLAVYSVSSVAPYATTPGAVVTHGPTWDGSASHVTLWCTATPSDHYEGQTHVRTYTCCWRYTYELVTYFTPGYQPNSISFACGGEAGN